MVSQQSAAYQPCHICRSPWSWPPLPMLCVCLTLDLDLTQWPQLLSVPGPLPFHRSPGSPWCSERNEVVIFFLLLFMSVGTKSHVAQASLKLSI